MNAVDVIGRLRQAGVLIWAEGGEIRFRAPQGALTDELRADVRAHRTEILELLARGPSVAESIPRSRRDRPLPLSFPQQRMWFFEQVHPGSSTYHMAAAWRLRGLLDQAALVAAFGVVIARHEVLRSRFVEVDGEPAQVAVERADVPSTLVDLTGLSPAEQAVAVERLAADEVSRPFDLAEPPLLRITLLRRGADDHVLLLTMHHIVGDMWSAGVLLRELMAGYRTAGVPAGADLEIQYADFAAWQREAGDGGPAGELSAYWKTRLSGAPTLLALPTDRPHPAVPSYRGGRRRIALPPELVGAVDSLCQEARVTRFMTFLAAWNVLLARHADATEVVVGTPVANRRRPELAGLIGFFVNTLALRTDLSGDPTVRELLDRVRRATLADFEHQELPVERLVELTKPERAPGRPPLFQVMFSLQNVGTAHLRLPGLDVETMPDRREATEFDLVLEVDEGKTGLAASLQFNADVFDGGTAERLLAAWQTVLADMVAHHDRRISALRVVGPSESALLESWNRTTRAMPPVPVTEQVRRQAQVTPDAVAVVHRDREISYAELQRMVTGLTARLRAAGVAAERPVAVCMPRSPEMIAALLAVMAAGAPYLPIDTSFPPDRLSYLVDDARAEVVLTLSELRHRFAGGTARVILFDGEPATSGPDSSPEPPAIVSMNSTAYVIYTSGSTGRPKGVTVTHEGLCNFLTAMDDVIDARRPGVWQAVTSVSFDIAALEMYWPLTHGWSIVLQDDDVLPGGARSDESPARQLGFSLFYFAAADQDQTGDPYRLLLDGARFADTHGFDAVWMPERHFDSFGGLYPNPAVTAAALAVVTERVQLRAGSVVLPLHHPVRVVEDWSVIDRLSNGRVGLSFASGWHANDFALAADPHVYENRRQATVDGIEEVRLLWRGGEAELSNGVGRTVRLRPHPRPVQSELPVWLTAAGSPETFRNAGTTGSRLLTHLLGQSVPELTERIALYRRAWREAGHEGDGHVTLMVHTFVGHDPDVVRDRVRGPFREYLRSSFGLVRALAPSLGYDADATEEDVETLLDFAFEHYYDGSALIGTVPACAAMAARLRDAGVDELACLIDFGVEPSTVLESLPLLDEVRRQVNQGGTADYGLAGQAAQHGVTHLQCTPSLAAILVGDPVTAKALASLDTLLVGGEALPPALAAQLDGPRLLNMYGPTETTIWSTHEVVERGKGRVTIGRPIANTTVHILDRAGMPVPIGVPGELCLGGNGVARGYLRRPGLTADRFRPSPVGDGRRIYRTGDRARFLSDGRIEFLGRLDRQVKLGGHRIELGEVENVLCEHAAVTDAAVVVLDDVLVAYLVGPSGQVSPAEMRTFLTRRLAGAAVPSTYVWLPRLPLTTSGKVDYRELPAPAAVADHSAREAVVGNAYVAPRNERERAVAEVWREVLKVDRVGVHDQFFALGGHSLMAIQLVARLRSVLGVDVGLRAVFESATVAELCVRLAGDPRTPAGDVRPPLRPASRSGRVPLSFAQQRVWFFEQMNPGVTAYHLGAALRLDGAVEPEPLRRAFTEIVRRHEILHSTFELDESEPVQVIGVPGPVPFPVIDLTGLPAGRRDEVALALASSAVRQPFDLSVDRPLRVALVRLGAREHVLLITTHHIVADSWSLGVLVRELGELYDAYRSGKESPLPPLPVQYSDYTLWLREWLTGVELERQVAHWRRVLDGAPDLLELPYDRPRPAVPTYRGAQTSFAFDSDLSDRLKKFSQEHGVTVFVTLLAGFNVLLHRWADAERVVLGLPVAGRGVPDLEPLIGFFANVMVLSTDLSGRPSFADVLIRVRDAVYEAQEHADMPVERLVAELGVTRDLRYNPLFQVMFVYLNDLVLLPALGDVEVRPLDVHQGNVFMDLNVAMEDGPDGLRGTVDYSTDLFTRSTVDWLVAAFARLLDDLIAGPARPITAPPLTLPTRAAAEETVPVEVVIAGSFTVEPLDEPLAYWAERLALPLSVSRAPFGQLFQELLDPASGSASNVDGVNVAMLRMADWIGNDTDPDEVAAEYATTLAAFQDGRESDYLVVLCPSGTVDPVGDNRWRERTRAMLMDLPRVVCLDAVDVIARYGPAEYADPAAFEAGRVPYTPEFFASLGTAMARQLVALLDMPGRTVVVDWPAGLHPDDEADLADAVRALARQERAVYVRAAARPAFGPGVVVRPGDSLAGVVQAVLGGRSNGETCLVLTADDAVARTLPDEALVEALPTEAGEMAGFLEHTWLLDPGGAATPPPGWWRKEDRR